MQERSDIAECEKEQIRLLLAQIKMQRGRIRATMPMTERRIKEIENEAEPRSHHKKPGFPSRKFPSKKLELKEPAKPKREDKCGRRKKYSSKEEQPATIQVRQKKVRRVYNKACMEQLSRPPKMYARAMSESNKIWRV